MRRSLISRTVLTLALAGAVCAAYAPVPARAQDTAAPAQGTTTPPAPANPPGPATQPPPPPGTTQPAPTQPAPAPAATPPPNYKLQYNGLIDGYYQFQFHNPKDANSLPGFAFYNVRHNTPTLSLAELNVFENAPPGGLGFKATLIAGDTADLNHGGLGVQGGEARYKNIQQLYGTYAFAGAGGGIDIGKFYTPFGYEVTESNGNYNYSRSDAYFLLPFYHAGMRVYTPSYGGLVGTFYLVKAIFNTATAGVQDDNKKPGYIGQLNFTDPKGKYTAITTLGLGKDKLAGVDTKVVLSDNDFTYNFSANVLGGLNYVYSKNTPDGGPKTTANGYAVYYRQQMTPKTAYALRFSGFDSKTDGTAGAPSTSVKPYEATVTYEVKPAPNFTTRLEYRHDHSNVPVFLGKDETELTGGTRKDQDLLTLAGIFTF